MTTTHIPQDKLVIDSVPCPHCGAAPRMSCTAPAFTERARAARTRRTLPSPHEARLLAYSRSQAA